MVDLYRIAQQTKGSRETGDLFMRAHSLDNDRFSCSGAGLYGAKVSAKLREAPSPRIPAVFAKEIGGAARI
jgi:hypothetical protein